MLLNSSESAGFVSGCPEPFGVLRASNRFAQVGAWISMFRVSKISDDSGILGIFAIVPRVPEGE